MTAHKHIIQAQMIFWKVWWGSSNE